MAACELGRGNLARAKELCAAALAKDAGYAVPHANLAILAALEKDGEASLRHRREAIRLGYGQSAVDRSVRLALAKTNASIGDALSDRR